MLWCGSERVLGSSWVVLIGVAFIVWIVSTTPTGRRWRQRLGLDRSDRAPREDREYLLRVCHGDAAQVERLLERERRDHPELTEAQAYRRAIRRLLRDRI
jgi:uncharacterized protein HemY